MRQPKSPHAPYAEARARLADADLDGDPNLAGRMHMSMERATAWRVCGWVRRKRQAKVQGGGAPESSSDVQQSISRICSSMTPTPSRSPWVVIGAWARCEATQGCSPPLSTTFHPFPPMRQRVEAARRRAARRRRSLFDLGKNQARLLGAPSRRSSGEAKLAWSEVCA